MKDSTWEQLFLLGKVKPKTLLTVLFYVGLCAIAYEAVQYGKATALTHTVMKSIRTGPNTFSGVQAPNHAYGFLVGLIYFLIVSVFWKVICELLLVLFLSLRAFLARDSKRRLEETLSHLQYEEENLP